MRFRGQIEVVGHVLKTQPGFNCYNTVAIFTSEIIKNLRNVKLRCIDGKIDTHTYHKQAEKESKLLIMHTL